MGDGTHDELVPRRCVAVPGIDSVAQYMIAIAVGCAPDPPRGGQQRFSSSRLPGRHRCSAESYRIDDVLDSQQLCARGRNDRANWVMLTRAAHCPTVRRLKSSGDGQRKLFRTHIDVRSTDQSCCEAVFRANSRSSVTLREIRHVRPIAPQTDTALPSRGHGRSRQGRKTVRE